MSPQLENPRPCVFDNFVEAKFGQFSADLHITSLSEFTVYKQSARHPDPVRRLLCLTETCLLERDPATYSIVSLRPLSSVAALVRSLENTQLFRVQGWVQFIRLFPSPKQSQVVFAVLRHVSTVNSKQGRVPVALL